jgi:acyl-CoA thioester hydrolase
MRAMADLPSYPCSLPIQVRFSDVDMMGHVSNTVYQTYFDSGKTHYFSRVLPDLDFVNLGVVGASVRIDYLRPAFRNTRLLVRTRIALLGCKSLTMEHLLVDEDTGETVSTCTAVMVCYAVRQMASVPIPDHWRRAILAFDPGVCLKGEAVGAQA